MPRIRVVLIIVVMVAGIDGSVIDHAYMVLQLFMLEGDWTLQYRPLPLELEFVRFAAPLTMGASVVLVLASGAWIAMTNARIRVFNEHIVVVGLNPLSWHTCSLPLQSVNTVWLVSTTIPTTRCSKHAVGSAFE